MSTTTSTKTTSASTESLLAQLTSLVDSSEIIAPDSPDYKDNTEVWSHLHFRHPRLVVRPSSLKSLSTAIAFLGKTNLDFKVRSQGFGNGSASDVVVSLRAFDQFEWDEKNKIVTLGPGAPWGKYYDEMMKVAPDYSSLLPESPLWSAPITDTY